MRSCLLFTSPPAPIPSASCACSPLPPAMCMFHVSTSSMTRTTDAGVHSNVVVPVRWKTREDALFFCVRCVSCTSRLSLVAYNCCMPLISLQVSACTTAHTSKPVGKPNTACDSIAYLLKQPYATDSFLRAKFVSGVAHSSWPDSCAERRPRLGSSICILPTLTQHSLRTSTPAQIDFLSGRMRVWRLTLHTPRPLL